MPPVLMTSRQRMLAALRNEPVDHLPCSFMLFTGLWKQSANYLDFIQRQIALGLDVFVQVPPRQPGLVSDSYNLYGLPVHFDSAVTVREWKENRPGERWPVLIKEYQTPLSVLRAEVNQDKEWPYGDHVPFLDDYLETRSRKFIIQNHADLDAFRYLLVPPSAEDIATFQAESKPVLEFARQSDLLIVGGWGVGADLIGWVYGLQNMIYAAYDHPDFIDDLLEIIASWNQARMQVVLDAGVDLYIKRAWYENCDFWSPKVWKNFVLPILKSDVELAHQHGTLFGYLITSNCMKLLDMITEAGVDVVVGVDPARWNLDVTRKQLGGKVCLWGGLNGHLTVESGTVEKVREEIAEGVKSLGRASGFILSPVDNVRELNPTSLRNVHALIEEWQRLTTGLNESLSDK